MINNFTFYSVACLPSVGDAAAVRTVTLTHRSQFSFSRRFPRHDVPLFRRRHDNLRLPNLLSRQLHITRQFPYLDPQPRQTFSDLPRNLRCERFHRRNVDDLEIILQNRIRSVGKFLWLSDVLTENPEDGHDGHIRLSRSCGCTDEHVFVGRHRYRLHNGLDPVEGLITGEAAGCHGSKFIDRDEPFRDFRWDGIGGRNDHFFSVLSVPQEQAVSRHRSASAVTACRDLPLFLSE